MESRILGGIAAIVATIIIGGIAAIIFIERVPAGYVGVKVNLLGSDKGVSVQELSPGRHYIGVNEQLFTFPTFTQTVGWTKGSNPELGSANDEEMVFQTSEGLTVGADIGAMVRVDPTQVNKLFETYRKGMPEIIDGPVRRTVQDALVRSAEDVGVESAYGVGKGALMDETFKRVREELANTGIIVDKLYWIGNLRLPDTVVRSINAKIAATQEAQQRQNEVEKAKAQADIDRAKAQGEADAVLIAAKAQAEANRLLSQSISPTLVEYKTLERWDGKLPHMTGGTIPFVNVK